MPFKARLTLSTHTHTYYLRRGLCSGEYIFFLAEPTNTLSVLKHKMRLNRDFLPFFGKFNFPLRLQTH